MPFSCITSATAAISESVFFEVSLRITESSVRSGMKSEKIFTCLTWPAITASVIDAALSTEMHLAQLPERDPVQRRAARLGGGDEGRLGFVLDGDDGDGAALRVRGLEDQAREPAVAGDQPERERLHDATRPRRPRRRPGASASAAAPRRARRCG